MRCAVDLLLATLPLCACVSSRDGILPQLNASAITGGEPLPACTYKCKTVGWNPSAPGRSWPAESTERLFRSGFESACESPPAGALHIELEFQQRFRDPRLSLTSAVGLVVTLGIFPYLSGDDLLLRARVERVGLPWHEYSYIDSVFTWADLLLIPWAWSNWAADHDPIEVRNDVFENLLLHFLRDLRHDLRPYVHTAPAECGLGPGWGAGLARTRLTP